MKHTFFFKFFVFNCLLFMATGLMAQQNMDVFGITVKFYNASTTKDNATLERENIIPWIAEAEKQYSTNPRLKINYTIEKKTTLNGRSLSSLSFNSMAEFGRFMDDNFDNVARTKTEGHLTFLVGDSMCFDNFLGKQKCWGGWANFPHDVNPFDRKKGIWLSSGGDKYLLTHEMGHLFSLKHTFEPYVGLNLQCNKEFGRKNLFNPSISHCNSCKGAVRVRTDSRDGSQYYVCENGVSNVMDYCTAVVSDGEKSGTEDLNLCQQERTANQRRQYMTKDGLVNYRKLAGLRGEGDCSADSECNSGEFCTAGILDLSRNVCKEKMPRGNACTTQRQCSTGRCAWGRCADADECQSASDCDSGKYCGDPVLGKRTCKASLNNGALCISGDQCKAGRCKSGFCSAEASAVMGDSCRFNDECRVGKCNAPVGGITAGKCVCKNDSDCGSGKWCNAGIDLTVNSCNTKLAKGASCGKAGSIGNDHKCKSGKCSGFPKYVCK